MDVYFKFLNVGKGELQYSFTRIDMMINGVVPQHISPMCVRVSKHTLTFGMTIALCSGFGYSDAHFLCPVDSFFFRLSLPTNAGML